MNQNHSSARLGVLSALVFTLTACAGAGTSGATVVTALRAAPSALWAGFLPTGTCLPSPNITITRAVQSR